MSVMLTERAVLERRKTVTRRLGWRFLTAGARLTLCRKVQGRAPGEPLVRLADVEVISVRRERLDAITEEDIAREGVHMDTYRRLAMPWQSECAAWIEWFRSEMGNYSDDEVTRIEWRYLDDAP